ncbi:MAG: GGDEF domain-containing protein, partial [bacterium]
HLAKQLEIIISIHKLYEKAIRPTKYDDLTQAFSRRYQKELLRQAYDVAKKNQEPLTICTVDINMFKEINDRYGHEIGDECLLYFAESVRANPFENMIFSRVGGDEFSFVFPQTDCVLASEYIAKLRQYLETHPFIVDQQSVQVAFGCGIAVFPDDGENLNELIRLSDARMYADKTAMKQK